MTLHHFGYIFFEGAFFEEKFIGHGTNLPDINLFIVVFVSELLGAEIAGGPYKRSPCVIISDGASEIS